MSLYTIGDLHLALSCDKPMEVFKGWDNHVERIQKNWQKLVKPEDTVVIVGDVSWGISLEESRADFDFIDKLNGKKIILRGNHDYWFSTKQKCDNFFADNGFNSISLLFNNAFAYDGYSLCGTRGWVNEQGEASAADKKVILREAGRLRLSLEAGRRLALEPIAFLHYPPVYFVNKNEEILSVLHEYGVKKCFYGHIHGSGIQYAVDGVFEGIDYRLVSCDYTHFKPILVL